MLQTTGTHEFLMIHFDGSLFGEGWTLERVYSCSGVIDIHADCEFTKNEVKPYFCSDVGVKIDCCPSSTKIVEWCGLLIILWTLEEKLESGASLNGISKMVIRGDNQSLTKILSRNRPIEEIKSWEQLCVVEVRRLFDVFESKWGFKQIEVEWIPRDRNLRADKLAADAKRNGDKNCSQLVRGKVDELVRKVYARKLEWDEGKGTKRKKRKRKKAIRKKTKRKKKKKKKTQKGYPARV